MKESDILWEGEHYFVFREKGCAMIAKKLIGMSQVVLRVSPIHDMTKKENEERAVKDATMFEEKLRDGSASKALKNVFGWEE